MCFVRFMPFAALLVAFLAFSGVAKAECGDFPKVPWWGNLTHGKTTHYVESKHGGQWAAYVKKWEKQHAKLKDIHERGSAVVVKDNRLKDAELASYIGKVGERVEVIRCLASDESGEGLDDFNTAAGGNKATGKKPR